MSKQRVIGSILAAFGAAGILAAGAAQAQNEMEVKIGFYPGTTFHMPTYVADAKGFFKQQGLNHTLISVANGPLMNSQMGSGAIDFGYQPPSNVGLAREQGLDQVFLVGNVTMPWVLIARQDLKVPSKGKYPDVIRDLKGLNWGVYGRGSDGELFMRVMAGDAKLDTEKDMTWIGVGGPATGLPALKAKRIDIYFAIAPAPTVATALGYGTTILDLRKGEGPGDFKGIHYNGLVTLRKTAQSKPKAVQAMVQATIQAHCWLKKPENYKEALAIAKTRMPVGELSEAQFEQMIKENLPTFATTMPVDHFKVWNDMLVRAKIVKQAVPADQVRWNTIPAKEPAC
jgi:NitT/TauT family transport system substrate-binding protein